MASERKWRVFGFWNGRRKRGVYLDGFRDGQQMAPSRLSGPWIIVDTLGPDALGS
jgi:hypothetical protein